MDNKTKGSKAKLQATVSVMMLTVIAFAEMYLMINLKDAHLEMISLVLVALVMVYFIVDAVMTLSNEREARREEHYENIFRSEKASYILLKKSFDEIEEKLNLLQENQLLPSQEIINAQKGIAKVIINRSQESADAVINSNVQVLEKLNAIETQNQKMENTSVEQSAQLSDLGTQTDTRLQDLLMQLKDAEIRLNQAIMSGTKVVVPATPVYDNMTLPVETVASVEETAPVLEEPIVEPVVEEISEVVEEAVEEPTPEPLIEEVPVVEEKPAMPDMSDPNKMMSPDDIAALLANMTGGDTSAEEKAAVEKEIEAVEEKPAMPDMSDPNKMMSPDEIAALIANL